MAYSATGDEYLLTRGRAVAVIGQVAAVLREFSVDGECYTETYAASATPPMGCGMVLMPWPNRVAGGRWRDARGVTRQLDITEPARGHAIHGLLRNRPYALAGREADMVELSAPIYPQHGWPFALATAVRYQLTEAGLQVTHTVTNTGPEPAVVGCGAHPYLRVGDVPSSTLTLQLRARRRIVTDDRMIPVGSVPLDGELADLPTGVRVGDLDLDAGFADLDPVTVGEAGGEDVISPCDEPPPTRFEHTLTAPDGRGVTLWADESFRYAQVFTPHDFPGYPGARDGGPVRRQAIAIEPMTCPADALNSGDGLIALEPGATWTGSWGISPF